MKNNILFRREQRALALNPIVTSIDCNPGGTANPTPTANHQEDHPMTALRKTFAFAIAAATFASAAFLAGAPAEARGGKGVFVQEYKFDKPMHGYSGHSGNYYCDYQRLPVRKCSVDRSGNEHCTIVSWTLRQMCH